jgi:ribonucleoside-diphosphate reductase beta chain
MSFEGDFGPKVIYPES